IYKQSNRCCDLVEARILNFFITTLYVKYWCFVSKILLYTMNKTEMDVGEIYYNNDGIQGALMMQPRISSQKVNLYKIRCRFWKSMKVTSRMMQDNKRKDSTQCSYLENVFLYLIIDLYFIFFIILSFAIPFPCFIFTFVKFSVGSISFCLVVNAFSFSFMNLPLTINGMM
uniref:Uncharacterized protein n=1 Tax=Strongyloides stercoralis TaxID=6248 RepID=A0AAF5DH80_STRER